MACRTSTRLLLSRFALGTKTANIVPSLGMSTSTGGSGPVSNSIEEKLRRTFDPKHVQVINESYMHNVPQGSETHFKVVVVSNKFEGRALIERHRSVNETLREELESGVHALSIVAKTEEQWSKMPGAKIEPSPDCRGGFGK